MSSVRFHLALRPSASGVLRRAWLSAALVVASATALHGQTVPSPRALPEAATAAGSGAVVSASNPEIRLLVGRSALLDIGAAISRVSLTTPDVADAMVTSPQQLLIHGKAPGTISLFVWDRGGAIRSYEVSVQRDLSALSARLRQLFPGEPIDVSSSGSDLVLSGTVSSRYVVEKAAEVAGGFVGEKENVVNLLRQVEGLASRQVMLRVRFAEVSRSALQELGSTLFSDGYKNVLGRTTTQQFPTPFFDQQAPHVGEYLVFSDYLNLFLFDAKNKLGAVVKALQTKGLFQSLAEPNLVAQNGREASFLAGGEYPYPAVQGNAGNLGITIVFKEFGIRLSFTPTILGGDVIHLKVRPEVSALDFTNAISLQGFRVPSLSTRRAETEVELRSGQTFAIAGLLNNTLTESMQKVPGIGDIPVLGLLFRSRAMQKAETELIVMITPEILETSSPGVGSRLPDLQKPFLERPDETVPPPAPYNPASSSLQPEADAGAVTQQEPGETAIVAPLPSAPSGTAVTSEKEQKKALERARREEERRAKEAAEAAEKQARADRKAAEAREKAERQAAKERATADRKAAEAQAKAERERAETEAKAARKAAEEREKEARRAADDAKKEADAEARRAREESEAHARALKKSADAQAKAAKQAAEARAAEAVAQAKAEREAAEAAVRKADEALEAAIREARRQAKAAKGQ